jgi:hypothetical protein
MDRAHRRGISDLGGSQKERDQWEHEDVDGWIILKYIVER